MEVNKLFTELVCFCQFISCHGAEASLVVNGEPITQEQAYVLVNAYLKLRRDG